MKVAIIGGTFNPIHIGHLFLAEEVRAAFGYERIVFIPAFQPVHKKVPDEVGPERRLEMVRLAVAPYPWLGVDDVELRRGGNSYTIDTVHQISRPYELEGRLGMVIGDDLARNFHTWKEPDALAEAVDIIVARRDREQGFVMRYPHRTLGNLLLPVSSTLIRERVRAGLPVRFLVPEEVLRYIERHRLYR